MVEKVTLLKFDSFDSFLGATRVHLNSAKLDCQEDH